MGLYLSHPGIGLGKALFEQVKLGKSYIKLWSHSANNAAHRFYLREGFKRFGDDKIGGDGIKEICLEWVRKIWDSNLVNTLSIPMLWKHDL